MNIPKEEEISEYDTLDERKAVEHFLGKSIAQAEQLFIENSIKYQEDLMWMGSKAFYFYLEAVHRYLQNPLSNGDTDFVFALVSTFEFRRENETLDVDETIVVSIVRYLLSSFSKFEISGDTCRSLNHK